MTMSDMLIETFDNVEPPGLLSYYAFDIRPEAGVQLGFVQIDFYPDAPGDGGFDFSYVSGNEPSYSWLVFQRFTEIELTGNNQIWAKAVQTGRTSGIQDTLEWHQGGNIGEWVDAWDNWQLEFSDALRNGIPEEITIDLSIAQDDGFGAPDLDTVVIYPMAFKAYRGYKDYLVQDEFTGTSGDLEGHVPDIDRRLDGGPNTSEQWTDRYYYEEDYDHNWFVLSANEATAYDNGGLYSDALYDVDAGVTDFQIAADANFAHGNSGAGLVGRVQDSQNFWLLAVKLPDDVDPLLGLYKVEGGVHTLVASLAMTGLGPLYEYTNWWAMRLSFEGDDILGEFDFTETGGAARQRLAITYTDATFNSETRAGIWAGEAVAKFRRMALYRWPVGFNPIVFTTTPVTSSVVDTGGVTANIYFYEGANGKTDHPYHSSMGYWVDKDTTDVKNVIDWRLTSFDLGVFLVKYEDVSGDTGAVALNYTLGQAGVWVDLFRANIDVSVGVSEGATAVIDVTVGVNDGTDNPLAGYNVTKRVTLSAISTGLPP